MAIAGTKDCSLCREVKPLMDYHKNKRSKDGREHHFDVLPRLKVVGVRQATYFHHRPDCHLDMRDASPPDLYPHDWDAIATEIKAACDWACQECDKPCRRPDEPFRGHRFTLTVAHAYPEDHAPDAPIVCVMALCAPCHLRFDVERKVAKRKK